MVLPFHSLSPEYSDTLLADGFTEELQVRLGKVDSLVVLSRGMVARYRGAGSDPVAVGRALNVAYVVSGAMRRSGGRVRVTAEMARTSNGTQVWADAFDRTDADLMTIETNLARAVAEAIGGRLRPQDQSVLQRRPTGSPAAWEAYLRGNALIARRLTGGLPGAVAAYREAVRLDPDFAAAWGRLAEGLTLGSANYGFTENPAEAERQARYAAGRAMALDSTSAEAWLARGLVLATYDRRPLGALDAFGRAVALDSTLAEAHYHYGNQMRASTEDQSSAERHLRTAHALDPSLANAVGWLTILLWKQGRTFEALDWLDTLTVMVPAYRRAGATADLRMMDVRLDLLLRAGDTAAVRSGLTSLLAEPPRTDSAGAAALAARIQAGLGDTTAARASLRQAERSLSADSVALLQVVLIAAARTALGERDAAIALLEGRRDDIDFWDQLRRPYFESLRREPRFARLMESVRSK